ncbi:hypothetical protein B9Z55_027711 [Caenorhabditis nigoni]|nr:hypothetical protein B9Z55_027711 [Caenorhabditis nigoni]
MQQTTLTKEIRNNIKHNIHQSFVTPEERRLAPQLTANFLSIFRLVSLVQPSTAKPISSWFRQSLEKSTIGGIAKMIDEFLDIHQQLIDAVDQRQACGQEITSHVEQDGILAKLKCDIDSLLDMMVQSKASESDMASGLRGLPRGDPGVVTTDAAATSGSRIGYAFRDLLCNGRSGIAPSLNNESLKLRSGLTLGAMVEESSRRAQHVLVSEDCREGLMNRVAQLTEEVLSNRANERGNTERSFGHKEFCHII